MFKQTILFINGHSNAGDSIRKLKVREGQAQSVHGSELCLNFPTTNSQFNWTSYSRDEIRGSEICLILNVPTGTHTHIYDM